MAGMTCTSWWLFIVGIKILLCLVKYNLFISLINAPLAAEAGTLSHDKRNPT